MHKRAVQATTIGMIGGAVILAILLFDPAFATLNGEGVAGVCVVLELPPSPRFVGPTTAFVMSKTYSDYHVFIALATAVGFTAFAGYTLRGRWFWANVIATIVNVICSLVVLGWVMNTIGCGSYTTLASLEHFIAIAGTLLGWIAMIMSTILLCRTEPALPSYQESVMR